jgi:CheY-like chemotaxis protein
MNETPRKRILIAEDVRAISLRLAHTLQSRGYEVESVQDGEACLNRVARFQPDLLVLDLMMPKVNGMEVLRTLRAMPDTAALPIIISTAKDFSTELKLVRAHGVLDVIIKPFDPELLGRKVDAYFSGNWTGPEGESLGMPQQPGPHYSPVLDTSRPHIRLWGTRGSIPVSGPRYAQHGGNTSCMEYAFGNERLIFDAGSGLREAGLSLLPGGPRHIHLFITHTHWDHIQGFPFFLPIYVPGYEITVYGERGFGKNIEALLCGQLDRDYFPVEREDLKAKLNFVFLDDNPIEIGGARITREFTHHPGATVAFKIEHNKKKIAYVPDNEFLQGYLGNPADIARNSAMVAPHEPLLNFLQGADVLMHEAQYRPDEYPKRIGWGHSNLASACALARLTGVAKWIVLHHDPNHDDATLHTKLSLTWQILADMGHFVPVMHGYDGMMDFV